MAAPDELESKKRLWQSQQEELKQQLICHDTFPWGFAEPRTVPPRLVGGVDISFVKDNSHLACAALVVLAFPSLEVLYEAQRIVELTEPYIAGYLAFREVQFLADLVAELALNSPQLTPEVILVDGNGILHPRGFGLASHLGVLTGIPTVGVAKSLFHLDGIDKEYVAHRQSLLNEPGDWYPLVGESGRTWGAALRSTAASKHPIFISIGHGISLETAVLLVTACCVYRVPEPTRIADLVSRDTLRTRAGGAAYSGEGGLDTMQDAS